MTDPTQLLATRNPVSEDTLRDRGAAPEGVRMRDEIMARNPRVARPKRRRVHIGGIIGGAAAVGAAALVGALFVMTGPQDEPPPSGAIPEGGWGMEATVRVEPSPGGLSLEDASERAAAIIEARGESRGMDNVQADVLAPGFVRVTVPWAQFESQFAPLLLGSPRVAIYDLDRVTLANSATDPARALRVLRGRPGTPRSGDWYAISGSQLVAGPLSAPTGGRRLWAWVEARSGVVAARARSGTSFRVLRDTPVADSIDITSIEESTGRIRAVLGRSVVASRPALVVSEPFAIGYGPSIVASGRSSSRPVATANFALGGGRRVPEWAISVGGLDAVLQQASVRGIGTPPQRGGRRIPTPKRLRLVVRTGLDPLDAQGAFREGSVRLVASGSGGFRAWEFETTTARLVASAGGNVFAYGMCALGPTAPVIEKCFGAAAFVFGPVAPGVRTVIVSGSDGTRVARMRPRNGWFSATIPAAQTGGGVEVVALDASGAEIGRR